MSETNAASADPPRSHPRCWDGVRYRHVDCIEPSGDGCIEEDCDEPAGTSWGPWFCPDHDVERLDRISASLARLSAELTDRED